MGVQVPPSPPAPPPPLGFPGPAHGPGVLFPGPRLGNGSERSRAGSPPRQSGLSLPTQTSPPPGGAVHTLRATETVSRNCAGRFSGAARGTPRRIPGDTAAAPRAQ